MLTMHTRLPRLPEPFLPRALNLYNMCDYSWAGPPWERRKMRRSASEKLSLREREREIMWCVRV
jgi:hypothetical protein